MPWVRSGSTPALSGTPGSQVHLAIRRPAQAQRALQPNTSRTVGILPLP